MNCAVRTTWEFLYRMKKNGFAPRGIYLEDVKLVNKMLNSIMTDIAVNASRYGLFVHNWKGDSLMPTVGVEGISFYSGIY